MHIQEDSSNSIGHNNIIPASSNHTNTLGICFSFQRGYQMRINQLQTVWNLTLEVFTKLPNSDLEIQQALSSNLQSIEEEQRSFFTGTIKRAFCAWTNSLPEPVWILFFQIVLSRIMRKDSGKCLEFVTELVSMPACLISQVLPSWGGGGQKQS